MRDLKLHRIFFLVSALSGVSFFVYAILFSNSASDSWTALSVLMPLCGICLMIGSVFYILNATKKTDDNDRELPSQRKAIGGYALVFGIVAVTVVVLVILNCTQ